jgi:hypothetical protein
MPAAVEAGEAVASFSAGIRQRRKGDGRVVEGAAGLIVKEVHLSHHRDRRVIPWWLGLFLTRDRFFCVTPFAFGFVGLDTGEMWREIGDVHRPAAAGLGTGQMFVLEGLDKSTVRLAFLV